MQSSYRAVSLRRALRHATIVAGSLGITRVTDITRLDRAGLPVFTSVRPRALHGSLCVNAGKGLSISEARVGAYMEAIEYAFAEPGTAFAKTRLATPRDVLDGRRRPDAILDLCPIVGVSIPLDVRVPCVVALDLDGGQTLVPAELAYFPYPRPPSETLFGSDTNGLASGTTLAEATLHGLLELIERDVVSFDQIRQASLRVSVETMPRKHQRIMATLLERGFEAIVRWMPNAFGVACFQAALWERGQLDPMYITAGYGCHLTPSIALTRALTEAAQSRLSFIHGARDDLEERYAQFDGWKLARRQSYAKKLLTQLNSGGPMFDFRTAPDGAAGCTTLDALLARTRAVLARAGICRVLRIVLTPPKSSVKVARIIAPLLEHFTPAAPRIGPRLARYAESA